MSLRRILFAGLAAGLVVALIWFSQRNRPVATSVPATAQATPVAAPPPASPVANAGSPASSATVAAPAAQPPSPAAPRLLADIPPGLFRDSLLKLDEPSRERALNKLAKLNVPREDYASLRAGPGGALLYICEPPPHGAKPAQAAAVPAGAAVASSTPTVAAAAVPISTPPVRHSKPGSANVLYLDFNGFTITGTYWNTYYGPTTYKAVPFDTDGDPTTFSDAEQAAIIQIWERVAEDYAPFDVDVTTEEPAVFTATTGRAVITKNSDANGVTMPSSTAGGVAWLDVFGQSDYVSTYSPALIYYNNLGSRADYIAEATSHELGHNFGLSHDGLIKDPNNAASTASEYYSGHGTGDISWAPIMGAPYDHNITQWSKGEYYLANNTEDALAIISGKLGYRADEAGGTLATTATVAVNGTAVSAAGILSSASDQDVFAVSTAAGTVSFAVATYKAASNTNGGDADIKLELLDASGTPLASSNPAGSPNASLTYIASATATYYLRLTPVGTGTPLVANPTGYTSYASIGQYTITGTIVPTAPAIVGTLTASIAAGQSFSYAVIATNSPTAYTATGLPAGLSIDAGTGLITGRPTAAGPFAVTLTATNPQGSGSATLALTITDAAPVITAQTTGRQIVTTGGSLTLSANALSANGVPTYQWKRNGFVLAGATASSLTLSPAAIADSGYYQLLATNTIGTTASAVIFVRVAPTASQVVGWGNNSAGQLTFPGGLTTLSDIAAGNAHVLALKTDGTVLGWGSNAYGQTTIPAGLANVVSIATGQDFSVALKADGTVSAWGRNSSAQGNQTSVPNNVSGVVGISAGAFHTLAVKSDGTVRAWGLNASGQTTVPADLGTAVAVAAGGFHSLALKSDGTVLAWGLNTSGQATVPAGLANVVAIAAGDNFSLALKSDGTVVAWGLGTSGQTSVPSGLVGVTAIAAGSAHAMALKADRTLAAWGLNTSGQTNVPVSASPAVGVRGGPVYSLVLRDLNDDPAPAFAAPPLSQSIVYGATATFFVGVTGTTPLTYRWQVSADGGNVWSNLADSGIYSGTATATLLLTGPTVGLTGSQFRCVVTNSVGTATSTVAALTVAKAPLTVTADPKTRVYGAANPALTFYYSGFVPGDTAAVVTAPVISTTAGPASNAGNYPITFSGGGAANYTLNFVAGNLSITPAAQAITFGALADTTYGAAPFALRATADSGLPVSFSLVSGPATVSAGSVTVSGIGTVTVRVTQSGNGNYAAAAPVDRTFAVARALLTITANNQTRSYGAANPVLTLSYAGFVNGDTTAIFGASLPAASTGATSGSPVGSYDIAIAAGSVANYSIAFVHGTLTVTPASQVITFDPPVGKTYGDAPFDLTASSGSGLAVSFALVSGPAAIFGNTVILSGAGTVTVRATQAGGDNFVAAPPVEKSFTVAPAVLTVTAADQSRIYGAANPPLTFSYSGFVKSDGISVLATVPTITTTADVNSQPGTYAITLSGGSAANYTLNLVPGTLTVSRVSQTIAFTAPAGRVYGAAPFALGATASSGLPVGYTVLSGPAFISGNTLSITGAGVVAVRASQSGDATYLAAADVDRSFTVSKAPLTVSVAGLTRTYGAANPVFTLNYSGFLYNDTAASLAEVPLAATSADASSPVATYAITLSGGSAANYTLNLVPGVLTVTKAPLTAKADNRSRTYHAANPALTITYSGFVNNDDVSVLTTRPTASTTAGFSSVVGGYPITVAGGDATNYAITTVGGTLTVTKAANVIVFQPVAGVIVGDQPFDISATAASGLPVTFSILSGPATLTGGHTVTISGLNTATIRATQTGDDNYLPADPVDQNFTVGKLSQQITFSALADHTYGDAAFALGATADSGLPVALAVVSGPASLVDGMLTLTGAGVVTLRGTQAGDATYTAATLERTFAVAKAPLTVYAANQIRTYGAQNPALGMVYAGFVNHDTESMITAPMIATAATATSPAGTYAITLSGGAADNYELTLVPASLVVTPAPLTIRSDDQTRVFGQADPAFTLSYDGFVNGEGPAVLTALPTIVTGTSPSTWAGSYPITVSGGSSPNYEITRVSGKLTITKAVATVTLSGLNAVYFNGRANYATATTVPAGLGVVLSYNGGSAGPIDAGSYSVVATISDNNYMGATSGTLVVAKSSKQVLIDNLSQTYDGSPKPAAGRIPGFPDILVDLTYNGSTAAPTNPGSYAVVATINDPNYQGSATGTLSIGKATAMINFANLSAAYDGTAKTAAITTVPAGLVTTVTYNGRADATDAGNYVVVATINDALYQGTATAELKIAQASAAVTLGNLNQTYNGSSRPATAITVPAGLNVTYTYNGNVAAPTLPGSYAVIASVSDINYAGTASGTLVIAKGAALITFGSLSTTYTGLAKTVTVTTVPANLAVNLAYGTGAGSPVNAGSYAVTAVIDDPNYQGTAAATLIIAKAASQVTWAPAPITYGTPLSATQLNASAGVPGGGTYVYSPAAGTVLPAGTSALSVTFTPADAQNYNGTTQSTSLTVRPAPLSVRADDKTKTQGEANPPLTITYTGFVNNDTPAAITEPTAATIATTNSPSGTYPITLTGGSAANYTLSLRGGTLVVGNKAVPVITWPAPAAITYGTLLSAAQLNATADVPGTFSYSPRADVLLAAGTQSLNVTFIPSDTVHYTSVTATQGLTVDRAGLTVTAASQSRLYGADNPPLTVSYAGFVNNETRNAINEPATGTTATLASPAGIYPITLTGGSAANYTLTLVPGELTVTKAALTATAADQTRPFGAADPAFTISYRGFVNNDTVAAITPPMASTTATTASAAGTYPITLSGGSAANYTFTYVPGTLTITPGDYTGTYFGTFGSGGRWALYVRRDATATYLAYLPARSSAIVVNLTVGTDGTFTVAGTEIRAGTATTVSSLALANPDAPVVRTAAAAAAFTLAGRINADGTIAGQLAGLGETLAGAADLTAGPAPASAGYYTASALGTTSSTTYAIVSPSGQALVLTTGAAVDGVVGTVNAAGQLSATTNSGASLALQVNGQSLSATVTPAGGAPVVYNGVASTVTPLVRVVNLSVRSQAGTGSQTLIVGLVVGGSGTKSLLLRGVGPTLIPLGVADAITDPALRLLDKDGTQLDFNDNWDSSLAPLIGNLGATPFAANSKDAALYKQLGAGLYSMHVYPATTGTGVVLAELYDADTNATGAEVVNISARTQVGVDASILILGFVIQGNTPKTLLIRGVGPTLTSLGVTGALADPQLYLYQGGTVIGTNDNWGGTTELKTAFATVGAGALASDSSKDAAMLVTLAPGTYTAQVSGVNRTTGVGLVEIYLMP